MSVVLCFPINKHANAMVLDDTVHHFRSALRRLATARPEYAGRLRLGGASVQNQSHLSLEVSSSDHIPLDIFGFDMDIIYADLQESSFSAKTFVNPDFIVPCALTEGGAPMPVSQIRLMFIDGGLLLFVYLHHGFADGSGMDTFIKDLARETRSTEMMTRGNSRADPIRREELTCHFDLPLGHETSDNAFYEWLERSPEYGLLPEPTGPTQPIFPQTEDITYFQTDNIGKIFVMDKGRLDCVREWLQSFVDPGSETPRTVSRYFALATLTWAHACKARLATAIGGRGQLSGLKPTFFNFSDWAAGRKGLFQDNDSLKKYFGNSVACVEAKLNHTQDLIDACNWRYEMTASRTSVPKLATMAERILEANSAINEDFVTTRTELFQSLPDIRRLGILLDSRLPHNFSFNTWMHVGSEAKFWFPGPTLAEPTVIAPDAIRRVQSAWAHPHALIVPRRGNGDEEIELLVTLPKAAMDRFEADQDWMSLVRRVIN